MPIASSTITILVLEVFAFFAVLAYASLESHYRLRKQRLAPIKTNSGNKAGQDSVKPKA